VTQASGYSLQAVASDRGNVPVQSVSSSAGAQAIINATNQVVKLATGVSTGGLTLQTAFDAAIGSTTITDATQDAAYFFTLYDVTNGRMVIGIVQDHEGNDSTIESGDIVSLVGTATMSASDYAAINTNHFAIIFM
jgi:hypothetical protein